MPADDQARAEPHVDRAAYPCSPKSLLLADQLRVHAADVEERALGIVTPGVVTGDVDLLFDLLQRLATCDAGANLANEVGEEGAIATDRFHRTERPVA